MKLSNSEKLILTMLCDIHKKLGIDPQDGIDPEFISSSITTDNTWAIDWKYQGIVFDRSEPDPPEVIEVVNYLDMWSFIESSFEALKDSDKQLLKNNREVIHVNFVGFDGNNEAEYISIARFLIQKLKRFIEFDKRDLDSHAPTIGRYRRMYSVFEPIRRTLIQRKMTLKELESVLSAN